MRRQNAQHPDCRSGPSPSFSAPAREETVRLPLPLFRNASPVASISSIDSARSCFSHVFPASSAFRRLASETVELGTPDVITGFRESVLAAGCGNVIFPVAIRCYLLSNHNDVYGLFG